MSAKIRLRFPSLKNLIDAGLLTDKELLTIRSLTDVSPGIAWLTPLHWTQQLIAHEVRLFFRCLSHFRVQYNGNSPRSFFLTLIRSK